MTLLHVVAGPHVFRARLEEAAAPKTCAAFLKFLPYRQKLIHARWSGEACWVPLGDFKLGVEAEHPISKPAPGQLLFYPGGISETEILFPYGESVFACKDGVLEGTPFLTIVDGAAQLPSLGKLVLWRGAQDIVFQAAP
ncbi:MAG TPA: DUF3830 family protein [Planctomycetota bacterium]|nr:DUF3830 family protein [Planctomycetota bacterium]